MRDAYEFVLIVDAEDLPHVLCADQGVKVNAFLEARIRKLDAFDHREQGHLACLGDVVLSPDCVETTLLREVLVGLRHDIRHVLLEWLYTYIVPYGQ
jgi:hypothetical protein